MPRVIVKEGVRVFKVCRPVVRGYTASRGSQVRFAIGWFAWLIVVGLISSCTRYPIPEPTAVNPETFPQSLPPEAPPATLELPPPVSENRTFVTIDGVPQYRMGPGDLLEVLITKGATQDKFQVLVRATGRIVVNFVEADVDGLTADQAAAEIAQKLSVYFRNPQVDVQVKEFNSKKVSILGAVALAPRGGIGTIPLTGRTTLLEVIARSGGLAPNAGLDRVRITRGTTSFTVNLYRYVQEGDISQDFIMDAGDLVFVPERVTGEGRQVFLLGEVNRPGPIPIFPSMTLSQLIGQAGGWTDSARFAEARVIRGNLNNPEVISVDLARLVLQGDRRIDQILRPNDIVFIPRTPIGDWNSLMAQLKPTLEIISLSLQPPILFESIRHNNN
jgi:polysaccharide export outer membrane protein